MPHTTLHKILRKLWKCKSYKYQVLQHVATHDKDVRYTFFCDLLSSLADDEISTVKTVFSAEATLRVSGNLNRHNLRNPGSSNPHELDI
jgi:hypothetical protein